MGWHEAEPEAKAGRGPVLMQQTEVRGLAGRGHRRGSDSAVLAPWAVARQAPLSMEFSTQEYWSG